MKSAISIIIIILVLLSSHNYAAKASYRENYLCDEDINYYFMEIWNLKINEKEIENDEINKNKFTLDFQIEDRYYQDEIRARFINGWNTSFFLGEFESN